MMPDQLQRAPLSFGQEQWWLLQQLQPDNAAHNIAFNVRLKGELNFDALEKTVWELFRRHDILRTTIAVENGEPIQLVSPFEPRELELIDLQHLAPVEREVEARRLAERDARTGFDLEREFLLRTRVVRMAPEDHIWLRATHHATCDGWALRLLLREIATLYNAFSNGEDSPLTDPPLSHADYARRQRNVSPDVLNSQLRYWQDQLEGADPSLNLPTDRPRPNVQTHNGAHFYFELSAPLVAALKERSREEGVTLFMTLLAAFSTWLHGLSGQDDFTFGSAIANRTARDTRDLYGFVVNTLALRQNVSGDLTFRELLTRTKMHMIGAFTHAEAPFRKLVQALAPARDASRSPLFQAFLVSVPFIGDHDLTGLKREYFEVASNAALYDVLLQLLDLEPARSDQIGLKLDYNADLFDDETARRMAARFVRLLKSVAENPALPLAELEMIPDEERAQILEWSAGESLEYSRAARVEELVAAQVEKTPDTIAVESESENLSYAELHSRAGQLAIRLQKMGAAAGERVAICLDRTSSLAVAVLGVLQSGAAYVPLDASYPLARLRATFDDAAPRALITTRALAARFGASADEVAQVLPVIFVDEMEFDAPSTPDAPAKLDSSPEDLAYLLYTSGSTGKPKGVAMPHRALTNLVHFQVEQSRSFENESARTLQFAPLGFDVSFQEIFSTWSAGGTLILISDDTRRDPFALLQTLIEKRVERLFLPFVALQQLAFAAAAREEYPTVLREVASAGEALLVTPEIRNFFARIPNCVLHNHYGPTEGHVVSSLSLEGDPQLWTELVPIGRPIPNAHLTILDSQNKLAPLGVPGELIIGGAPVADGYWQRPELTAEKFGESDSIKTYRTGDLARWRSDGELEFLGRRDAQIKVRGFRVELGEIEAALLSHPGVREAVVVAESAEGNGATGVLQAGTIPSGETRLLACLVAKNESVQAADVRRFLREHLPEYMIPAEWVLVDALPLTPSGKLDRRALAELRTGSEVADSYSPPQNELEETLARAWSDVLGVSRVGRTDNFFELGGHSLLGTLVVSRLRDELHIELPLYHLFEAPTIEQLAARIETLENKSDESDFDSFDEGRI